MVPINPPPPPPHSLHVQQSCVQFKEVVPINEPSIIAKIHQTYRIQYIKDVILPRALDDATYTTLSSLALFNNVEVSASSVDCAPALNCPTTSR